MDLIQNINEIKANVIANINNKFDSIPQSVIKDIFNERVKKVSYYQRDSKGNVDIHKTLNSFLQTYSSSYTNLIINTDNENFRNFNNYSLIGSFEARIDEDGVSTEHIVLRIRDLRKKSLETLIKIDACYDFYETAFEKKENAAKHLLSKIGESNYMKSRSYTTDIYYKITEKSIKDDVVRLRVKRFDWTNLNYSNYVENVDVRAVGDFTFLTNDEMSNVIKNIVEKKINSNKKTISRLTKKNEEFTRKMTSLINAL